MFKESDGGTCISQRMMQFRALEFISHIPHVQNHVFYAL